MMTLKLYPFPISRYCEKTRWALGYKSVDNQRHDRVPGAHRGTVGKYAAGYSVPLLVADDSAAHGSARIITLPGELAPAEMLTPADPNRRGEAVAREPWLDYRDCRGD